MINPIKFILFILAFSVGFSCEANDSVVEISIGGLSFSQEKNISMLKERLEISQKEIAIQYEFQNTSSNDIDVIVGFPIPPFGVDWPGNTQIYPPDFNDFTVSVNGIPVQYSIDVKALTEKGEDITSFLKEKKIDYVRFGGFDINPLADGMVDSPSALASYDINSLSNNDRQYLISKGALRDDGVPLWLNKITYYWKQKFPAGEVIKINHKYTPYLGGAFAYYPTGDSFEPAGSACIDPKLKSKMQAYLSGNTGMLTGHDNQINFQWARYILVTANSWKMPIKNFELILRKAFSKEHKNKENYISLCWEGELKKISETEFRSEMRNFKPTKDLLIYWYSFN